MLLFEPTCSNSVMIHGSAQHPSVLPPTCWDSTLQQPHILLHVRLVLCHPETILTILLQKRQGPEPSCSHTMRPHLRQLFTSLCLLAWQSQGWRP